MSNDARIPEKYKNCNVWSYSKLNSFYDCQMAYCLQRLEKVDSKDNIWSLLGSVTHEVIEKLIKKEITKEEAKSYFIKQLDDYKFLGTSFPTEQMENNYRKSILHYLDNFVLPDVKDFKIELKSFLEVDNKNVLIGFIDFVIQHHDGSIEIRDFKTSTKFTGKDLDDKARQLVIYSEMIKQAYPKIKDIKISFDMLKYARVTYKDFKRSKVVDRHKLVLLMRDYIEKDLASLYNPLDVETKLIQAIAENKIPKEIEANYTIEPFIQYYNYNETHITDLYLWIYKTIDIINKTLDFTAKIEIDPESSEFFCANLCGVSKECKAYQNFLGNKEKNKIIDDDLF